MSQWVEAAQILTCAATDCPLSRIKFSYIRPDFQGFSDFFTITLAKVRRAHPDVWRRKRPTILKIDPAVLEWLPYRGFPMPRACGRGGSDAGSDWRQTVRTGRKGGAPFLAFAVT